MQDDRIGSVNVDITCLLPKRGPNKISGWFPLYDSIRGNYCRKKHFKLSIFLKFLFLKELGDL